MVLNRLLRAGEHKLVRRLSKIADHVETLEPDVQGLSDEQLRAKTVEFRERFAKGETLDELLPEAFAVTREAAVRTIGQRHFKVQMMGGGALHLGNVAEMKTGEGKTLTCVLAAYLNAIPGKGVHVVTVNDYLAKRDAENMGRVHRFLGLTVGVILSEMTPPERREAYAADITYGTNNEFGFDYLRDNMTWLREDMVQRGHYFAVVDEADSILIDEARTPLIISGPAEQSARWYTELQRIAALMPGIDTTNWTSEDRAKKADQIESNCYEIDQRKRTIAVTEKGIRYVEDQLGIDNLYEVANTPLVGYMNNAIKAKELFKRDKDYIVRNGEVLIVDEFTGRVLVGRRYNEGMHQAIEAKEKVQIQAENQTLATITLQNYFRLYEKLAGMTGTAQTEAAELHQIYKMNVVSIPTNKPMVRDDQADQIYKTEAAKFEAVADDIAERHREGQPVLVGTTSVEKSEYLSKLLLARQVPHEVLNAKHHEREATIVAEAGRAGAVTVATNMAGRGTDIMLGGNPEFMAEQQLRERGLDPVETRDEYEAAWPEAVAMAKRQVAEEAEEVRRAGGLYVLGTERHESRRIDNQLRGRSGRQGDPGTSRFYLSLGDELMRRFNGAAVEMIMNKLNVPEDVPITSGMVTKAIRSAQTQVETQNFEIRKNILKYDEVMNNQRTVIYEERRRVLGGENLKKHVENMLEDVIAAYIDGATSDKFSEDWDLDALWTALGTLYPVSIRWQDLVNDDDHTGEDFLGEPVEMSRDLLYEKVVADAKAAYRRREAEIDQAIESQGGMRELERQILLTVLDRRWREHLYEMDYLKEGISLRALAQRDPVIEYQREGYDMFVAMLEGIREEAVGYLFNVQVTPAQTESQPAVELSDAPSAADPASSARPAAPATDSGAVAGAAAASAAAGAAAGVAAGSVDSATATPTGKRGRHASRAGDPTSDPTTTDPTGSIPPALRGFGAPADTGALQYSGPSEDGTETTRRSSGRARSAAGTGGAAAGGAPSRNQPCPCGSGRKYKHCHGAATSANR
ncbi:preprotein translocase subunit SecA [Pseudonocardia eucalypti]|uniref:Protein translocase subunit SecA n=1 Tax=Pseudonocardia eucalypti TaxID=648755 RepID=A0ABP9PRL4_9PSEU|nr:preprotein translocase subunit SecA [Pseudonocardia eucalypti]